MPTDNPDKKDSVSFEEAMAELGQLVTKLEAGELSLEMSINAYKRGIELVQFCTSKLDKVEKQIKILDGEILKPFIQENMDGTE